MPPAMRYFLYILQSVSTSRFYIGHTQDLSIRFQEHNDGRDSSTRGRGPWELFYTEEFPTRSEASRRERQIKQMKSRRWIEELARASRSDREGR
jgi:putative endonuclease